MRIPGPPTQKFMEWEFRVYFVCLSWSFFRCVLQNSIRSSISGGLSFSAMVNQHFSAPCGSHRIPCMVYLLIYHQNQPHVGKYTITRWWFQIFFIFTLTLGRFPFWRIFFKGVGTPNQINASYWVAIVFETLFLLKLTRFPLQKRWGFVTL